VQDANCSHRSPPDHEQRFDQLGKIIEVFDELLDACLELYRADHPGLQAELRKVPRRSLSKATVFDFSRSRWVGSFMG
jgi:hypothetical protein